MTAEHEEARGQTARAARERLVATYEQKHAMLSESEARAMLAVGSNGWPLAFPLFKSAAGLCFVAPMI